MHGRDHNEGPLAHCLQDWLHQPVEVELDLLLGQDQVALHVEAPMFVLVGLFFIGDCHAFERRQQLVALLRLMS